MELCYPFLQSQNKLVLWLRKIKIHCIIGAHLANRVVKHKSQQALSASDSVISVYIIKLGVTEAVLVKYCLLNKKAHC